MNSRTSTHPDVTLAREESLGDACCVQAGSGDVQDGHEEQPAHLTHGGGPQEALRDHKVQRGDDSTEAQTHKHTWDTEDRTGIHLTIYIALLDIFRPPKWTLKHQAQAEIY